jgi:hypothetical protein
MGGKLSFVDCEFSEYISLENKYLESRFSFQNCKFSTISIDTDVKEFRVTDCEFEQIEINSNVDFLYFQKTVSPKGRVKVGEAKIKSINISNCSLSELIFGGMPKVQCNDVRFSNLISNKISLFGEFKDIKFYNGNDIGELSMGGSFNSLIIVYSPKNEGLCSKFGNLMFLNNQEKCNVLINGVHISSLSVIGLYVDTYLDITDLSCETFSMEGNLGLNGSVKLKSCNEIDSISFKSVNLSNLEIFNSDFSQTKFVSDQSIFEKIKWQSVEWSENLNFYSDPTETSGLKDSFRRDTLRMLKLSAQNQQDIIGYIKFHALEQQAYKIQIKNKKWYHEDRILLFLNFISNNHGLSWKRGILFTVCVGSLFFILSVIFLNNPYFKTGWTNWSDLWNVAGITIKLFSQSLYAAHSFDYLNDFNPKGIVFLFDLIGRIFLAYGYYQTVSAFRKFSKK